VGSRLPPSLLVLVLICYRLVKALHQQEQAVATSREALANLSVRGSQSVDFLGQ
jgi:hypothetical protein